MKNIIFAALPVLLMASCADETTVFQSENSEILKFSIQIPSLEDMRTRADGDESRQFGDGTTVSELRYYVYPKDAKANAGPVLSDVIEIVDSEDGRGGSLNVQLPKDVSYDVVFLATSCDQTNPDSKVYFNTSDHSLNVNYAKSTTNDEGLDCFYDVTSVNGDKYNYEVVLKRPFAQLNIGAKDLETYNSLAPSKISSVGVSVSGVYSAMNVLDGAVVGEPANVTIPTGAVPEGYAFPSGNADYLSMNYLLVNEQKDIDVTLTAYNGQSPFSIKFSKVPVKRNCRTNIFGNLFTAENDFTIEINPDFGGNIKKDLDDPYAEYDLVLTVVDDYHNIKKEKGIQLDVYNKNNIFIKAINLDPYIDSKNMIKVTWDELNLSNAYNIRFKNFLNDTLKCIIKCDINKINVSSLFNFAYSQDNLVSVDATLDISNVTDMTSAFYNCTNLTTINSSNWDTSNVTKLEETFKNCKELINLDTSKWDTSNISSLKSTFQNCENLTNLDVSNWNVSNVTSLHYTFYYCGKLESLDVSQWDTSNVIDLTSTFSGCSGLTSLDVSQWDTSNVTKMLGTFRLCSSLVNLDVSNWNSSKVVDLRDTFALMSKCASLDLHKWDVSNVTNLSNTFENNGSQYIDVSTWDVSNVKSLNTTFGYCQSLTELDVSNWNVSNVTDLTKTFICCSKLKNLNINDWNVSNVTTLFGTFSELRDCTELDFSKWNVSKVNSLCQTFKGCSSLTNLKIYSWDISNVTDMSYIFQSCTSLTGIEISDWDVSKVANMQYAFNYCTNLIDIDLSKWNVQNVTNLVRTFSHCEALNSLNIADWNVLKCNNLLGCFEYCENLANIDLSKWNVSNVESLSNLFHDCSNLKYLNIAHWNVSKNKSLSGLFSGCTNLENIDLSKWDVSNVTEMSSIFRNCNSLTKIDLSNWNTSSLNYYMAFYEAFLGCSNLSEINLAGWDLTKTSGTYIFYRAFKDCSNLSKLDISNWDANTLFMASQCFQNCKKLSNIIGPLSNISEIKDIAILPLSNESAMVIINGLNDVSTSQTVTFNKSTYNTLTEDQIAIATAKGWTVKGS